MRAVLAGRPEPDCIAAERAVEEPAEGDSVAAEFVEDEVGIVATTVGSADARIDSSAAEVGIVAEERSSPAEADCESVDDIAAVETRAKSVGATATSERD